MKQWQIFEQDCLNYLINNNEDSSKHYKSKGSSDSTISDIQVIINGEPAYYIEAKMAKSQCGQFVLLKDNNNQFYFSEKNKLSLNDYSKEIINGINENKLNEVNKKNIPLILSQELIVSYILEHYKEKEVKYLISKDKDNYHIIPLTRQDLLKSFEFSGTLRMKKSGSRSLTKSFELKMIEQLGDSYISQQEIENKTFYQLNKEGDFIFNIDGYDLYFKQQENKKYIVRILSNTNNYCVIFSLNLKKLNT